MDSSFLRDTTIDDLNVLFRSLGYELVPLKGAVQRSDGLCSEVEEEMASEETPPLQTPSPVLNEQVSPLKQKLNALAETEQSLADDVANVTHDLAYDAALAYAQKNPLSMPLGVNERDHSRCEWNLLSNPHLSLHGTLWDTLSNLAHAVSDQLRLREYEVQSLDFGDFWMGGEQKFEDPGEEVAFLQSALAYLQYVNTDRGNRIGDMKMTRTLRVEQLPHTPRMFILLSGLEALQSVAGEDELLAQHKRENLEQIREILDDQGRDSGYHLIIIDNTDSTHIFDQLVDREDQFLRLEASNPDADDEDDAFVYSQDSSRAKMKLLRVQNASQGDQEPARDGQ